jgi:hypothetical protein
VSQPIYFNGKEYANREAMPPEVQVAFDQYAADAEREVLDALDEAEGPAAGATAPAWGGARPAGAVPVPMAFDGVTSLGPASAVYGHAGGNWPSLGPARVKVLVIYQDGFAFDAGRKGIATWRWDEIASIVTNSTMNGGARSAVWTSYNFTLLKTNGEQIVLDNNLPNVQGAVQTIKQGMVAVLKPRLADAYALGQTITFGAVSVQKQNGLQLDGKWLAWDAIMDVKVERGRLMLTMRDGQQHQARASAIPNIELMAGLIGLNFYEPALAYF